MTKLFHGLLIGGLALGFAGSASAATVDLRVEGRTATLYEGTVTTGVAPFQFTAGTDQDPHPCDGTGQYGAATSPSPTRGAALTAAAHAAPFAMSGSFGQYGAAIASIAGEDVGYDAATSSYLAEYKNGAISNFGACGDPIADGDDVVFAWGDGSSPVLKLSGPATVAPGADIALAVKQEDSGAAVAGATVGGATSAADGTAHVAFAQIGPHVLKASKSGFIRSNAVTVCVTDGHDGACGTTKPGTTTTTTTTSTPGPCVTNGRDGFCGSPDKVAANAAVTAVSEGTKYGKGKGPRQLGGKVSADGSGIADVRLRLTRNDRGKCATYDGKTEKFKTIKKCGADHGVWFSIGANADWSYLLPSKLGRGRYVLDVQVVDKAGNKTAQLARGTSRVVFTVG